ncbi:MAG: pentapeptide repeat-containing protein [Cyanobacteria bacterium P01_G01_bin.39]
MKSSILNCGQGKQESELVRFTFQCPKLWQELQVTENDSVRFCDACQEKVFYCTDKQEAEQHARQGHCIAIASELTASVDHQYRTRRPVLGRPKHTKAWAKDIFDHQKHELVRAIRDYAARTSKADRQITVAEINYKDLSHVDLSGIDLRHVDLSNVNLSNTNLSHTNLSNANLSNAYLRDTNLSNANLSGVNLSHVWKDSFSFENINLDGAILEPEDKIQYLIYQGKRYHTERRISISIKEGDRTNKSQGIEYLQQALSMVKENSDCTPSQKYRPIEVEVLWELANKYLPEDEQKAEELYQQALLISQEIGDRSREAQILNKLGNIYLEREAKLEALKYFQQAQIIFEGLDKRANTVSNLRSLISICENISSEKYLLAEYYQKLLSYGIKNLNLLNKLAIFYADSGNKHKAFEYLQQAMSLQEKSINTLEITYLGAEIYLLKAIVEIYEGLSDFSSTLKYYKQLLSLKRRISVRPPEAESFNKIVQAYWLRYNNTRKPAQLLQYLLRLKTEAFLTPQEKKYPLDLCIGTLYLEQGKKHKAIKHYEQGIVALRQLRKQPKLRSYDLENLNSDRKRLLAIIDRHNNGSDKTLNLSSYSQRLLQDRESDRLDVEQIIEKITTIIIMVRYT